MAGRKGRTFGRDDEYAWKRRFPNGSLQLAEHLRRQRVPTPGRVQSNDFGRPCVLDAKVVIAHLSMARILVTGGAGYIGSHTVHLLRRHGNDVIVADDLSRGHAHNVENSRFYRLNLLETEKLGQILADEKIEAVIHFAAYIAVGESTQKPELYFTAMERTGVRRIVFSSTAAVYGTPERVPIPEDSPYAALSPYGDSKVMVERILDWLDQYRGVRSICLRYFNACGAEPGSGLGEEHEPETHLIPLLFRAIDTGKPVTIFGDDYDTPDGTCIRDYIHVSDLAQAHIRAVESLMAGGDSGKFNVGTGTGRSVLEVMRAVEQVTGQKVPYTIGPRRAGDPPSLVANSDKLQSVLGWKPVYTDLADIVRTAWDFHRRDATAPASR
jgi:UDP-glucose-4-epimerase GalE